MKPWTRPALGLVLTAACALSGTAAYPLRVHAATTTPVTQALAYLTNGQVTVFETQSPSSTITTVGPGQSPAWAPNGSRLLFMNADTLNSVATISIADAHGANPHQVARGAYLYISAAWSPDSKYVLYTTLAGGSKATDPKLSLNVEALNPDSKQTRTLGTVSVAGGCVPTATAQQSAIARAQGAYRGTPSTLIWAQPSLVVVQSSCSGAGLTLLKLGSKPSTLPSWSAGVLSPDGKTIAAALLPPGAKAGASVAGLIAVGSGTTETIKPAIPAAALTWTSDSKALLAVAQPTNTVTGMAQVTRLTLQGRVALKLGTIPATGAYHPSLARGDASLALAVVANSSSKAVAPPAVAIDLTSAIAAGPAVPRFIGSEPAWRP